MKLIFEAFLVVCILSSGCTESRPMTIEEIADAVNKCRDVGMKPISEPWGKYGIANISCQPTEGKK